MITENEYSICIYIYIKYTCILCIYRHTYTQTHILAVVKFRVNVIKSWRFLHVDNFAYKFAFKCVLNRTENAIRGAHKEREGERERKVECVCEREKEISGKVCGTDRDLEYADIYIHIYIFMHIYNCISIYASICVSTYMHACVCVWLGQKIKRMLCSA